MTSPCTVWYAAKETCTYTCAALKDVLSAARCLPIRSRHYVFRNFFLLSDDGPIVVSEGRRAVSTRRSSPHCSKRKATTIAQVHPKRTLWGSDRGAEDGNTKKKEKENSDADDDGGFVLCV